MSTGRESVIVLNCPRCGRTLADAYVGSDDRVHYLTPPARYWDKIYAALSAPIQLSPAEVHEHDDGWELDEHGVMPFEPDRRYRLHCNPKRCPRGGADHRGDRLEAMILAAHRAGVSSVTLGHSTAPVSGRGRPVPAPGGAVWRR
jgi:hypothetical protein